jgi:hypothetical protein
MDNKKHSGTRFILIRGQENILYEVSPNFVIFGKLKHDL